jgi:hypothetical protein
VRQTYICLVDVVLILLYLAGRKKLGSPGSSLASIEPGPPEVPVVLKYASLKKLYIHAPAKVLDALLLSVSSGVLADLTLRPQSTPGVPGIEDVAACLGILNTKNNLCVSLKRFSFQCKTKYGNKQEPNYGYGASNTRYLLPLPSSHFQPIQRISQLECLQLETGLEAEAGRFARDIAANLPFLVECSFSLSFIPTDVTALHILAISCPNLVRLQLPLKTQFVGYDHLFSTPKSHRLQHLTVSDWPAEHQDRVDQKQLLLAVRHLSAVFPYLRVLDGGFGWEMVMSMLGTLQNIARAG